MKYLLTARKNIWSGDGEMRRFNRISTCICIAYLTLILTEPLVCADIILDAVNKVSLEQYRTYQVDIENMGLGFYGGQAYNQGLRNRNGWADGGTLGNQETRLYLVDHLSSMGLDVSIQGSYANVVAELPGIQTPGDIYIVCGHYDTTSNDERPGGDDNASGTAGVLEVARVLTQYNFNSTLRFIGFNAEEDWMKGSQDYVDTVVLPNNENIVGVINLDMILRPGWDSDPQEPIDLDIDTGDSQACFAWVNIFIDAADTYAPSLVIDPAAPDTANWDAGDQGPFISAGYPALLAIENTAFEIWSRWSNAYYHTSEDASDALANDIFNRSGIIYDYDFATNVVRATVATLAIEAGLVPKPGPYFHEFQALSTNGADDLESFTIGSDNYLAVANMRNDSTHNIDSQIYRWNGTSFVEFQSIPTSGARDWEFFTVGGDHYLVVANMRDDFTYNIDSILFKWNGAAFVEYQSIPTTGAGDWEFFTIGSDYYMAVANEQNDSTYNTDSNIYRWNGTSFVEFQSVPTNGANGWESFTIGGEVYLAAANMYNGSTYNIDSRIYRWDGAGFVEFQSIPANGATDWEFFTVGSDSYLAIANMYNGSAYNIDSRIYKWNGADFVEFQSIPTNGATDWEFFTIDSDSYLAVANMHSSSTHNINSKVYKWNGTNFAEFASIPTHGANDWEFFTISSNQYLATANTRNDSTHNIESTIYQYHGQCTGSFDDDCDVDLDDYAIFAAAWLTTEGQPGWNADCDISIPADNIINLRDLLVFVENWLAGK